MSISFVGLDVHLDATSVHVLDSKGHDLMKCEVATGAYGLIAICDSLPGEVHVAMEESEFAHWLSDLLEPRVTRVVVCNASKIVRTGSKDDAIDARILAEMLMLNRLHPVDHGAWRSGQLREHARSYERVVRQSSASKNQLKALLRRVGVSYRDMSVYTERELVLSALRHDGQRVNAELLYSDIDFKTEQRNQIRRALVREARRCKGFAFVESLPGFGPIRTGLFLAFVGTPHRFHRRQQLWQYAGLGLERRSSGTTRRTHDGELKRDPSKGRVLGLNPDGNSAIKSIARGAADTACHSAPEVGEYYDRKRKRKGDKIAKVMVARRLLVMAWTLWKNEEVYDPAKARWIDNS